MSTTFTWYGHAAIGLTIGKYHLLVDPFFTGNPAASTAADKVAADYILVSHGHGDHIGDAVAIAKRTGATVITNAEISDWFEKRGIKAHAQHLGGGHTHPFGYLKLTLALHGSGLPDGSNGGNPCGFLLTAEGKKVYLAADTGLFGDMKLIGDEGLDLAAVPIGDNYTMGPDDALRAVKLLHPKHVIPSTTILSPCWPRMRPPGPGAWKPRPTRKRTCSSRARALSIRLDEVAQAAKRPEETARATD